MDAWRDYDWVGLLEKVAIALVILVVTWALARLVKWAITKLVTRVRFLQRESDGGESLGEAFGQIASLLVWLFGLIAVLQVFDLDRVLTPIEGMLDGILTYLPNIIGAAFVFFIGYIIAKIVREITQTALDSAGLDHAVSRFNTGSDTPQPTERRTTTAPEGHDSSDDVSSGATASGATTTSTRTSASGSSTRLSSVVANLVFAVILIVVGIAALQILGISAISGPAEQMLGTILDAIPRIIAAAVLLGIGYVVARFAGQLLETTLRGLGADRASADLGIVPQGRSASSILGRLAQLAILLFFAVMAAQVLNFPVITNILEEILALGGRVLFGGAIIAAGVIIAGMLRRTIGGGTAGTVIYWSTTVLFVAMGLTYMGIADSIINLAFGAVVIGAAAAAALAYGIGGREAAARSLRKVETKVGPSTSGDPSSTPPTAPL
ncbi:mechanosensitive ion channel [Ornithinimicrobium sp. LYQ103]|uniref:mechanosensitive ion channel n=1 Tax=Ornithinimicrobium sp. LYQ103 TaxID=3378796 RepID=UPI003853FB57